MKTTVIVVASSLLLLAAPRAEGLRIGSWLNKAKNAISSIVNKHKNLVKNVVKGVTNPLRFAQQALKAAGGVARQLMGKMHDAANALSGKAKSWLLGHAKKVAARLPGVFAAWAKKGIAFGKRATDALQGKLHALLDKGIAWGKGFVDKGVKFGLTEIARLRELLRERVKLGLGFVREVARGKDYVVGMVATAMKPPKGIKLSHWFNKKLTLKPFPKPHVTPVPLPKPRLPGVM